MHRRGHPDVGRLRHAGRDAGRDRNAASTGIPVLCLRTTLTSASAVSSGSSVSVTLTATTTSGGWTSTTSSSFVQTFTDAVVPVDTGTWYQLVNTKSKACVSATPSNPANGSDIFQVPSCGQLGTANESWLFTTTANGYTTVSNGLAASSLVWGVAAPATSVAARVQLQTAAAGSPAQQWKPVKLANGLYQFVNLGSGLCLSTDGSSSYGSALQQQPCASTNPAQTFSLNSTGLIMAQAATPPSGAVQLACTSDGWNASLAFPKPVGQSNATTYQVTANGVAISTNASDWYTTVQLGRDNMPVASFSPGRYTIVVTRVQSNGTTTLVGSGTVAVGLPSNRTTTCG